MLATILITASIFAAAAPDTVTIKVLNDATSKPLPSLITILLRKSDPEENALVIDQETDQNGTYVTSVLRGLNVENILIGVAVKDGKNPNRVYIFKPVQDVIVIRLKPNARASIPYAQPQYVMGTLPNQNCAPVLTFYAPSVPVQSTNEVIFGPSVTTTAPYTLYYAPGAYYAPRVYYLPPTECRAYSP